MASRRVITSIDDLISILKKRNGETFSIKLSGGTESLKTIWYDKDSCEFHIHDTATDMDEVLSEEDMRWAHIIAYLISKNRFFHVGTTNDTKRNRGRQPSQVKP